MDKSKVSPLHAKYTPLLEPYYKRVEEQEASLVKLGVPAEGGAAFIRGWYTAWRERSLDQLSALLTPDVTYVDSSTREDERHGRELFLRFCERFFTAFPDMVFYPQDGTTRSMPYWDFTDGVARITVPWRGVGRFTGTLRDPSYEGFELPPSGRDFNFIGIDRYVLTEDWRITRVDTDWDLLGGLSQMYPGVPEMHGPLARTAASVAKYVLPVARRVGVL